MFATKQVIVQTSLLLFFFSAFVQAQNSANGGSAIPVDGYALVWQDEFNGTSLDTTKWHYRALGPRRDAVNVRRNVTLDGDGHLVLTTSRQDTVIHTGMIGTEGTFATTYGYFECRAILQTQVGHWSAFWLQSPTITEEIDNPSVAGTEIDIFEYLRREGDSLQQTLHWNGYREARKSANNVAQIAGLSQGWHTFGLLWTDSMYVFYVDGQETWRTSEAISNRPQYMILSLEVGSWAGNIADATLPDHFYVDYVRVYKKSNGQ